jgi:ParB-like nuclease domain
MMSALLIENLPIDRLRPWPRNARTHSRKQIRQIAESIRRFGFTNPVLIDGETASWLDTAASKLRGSWAWRRRPACALTTCRPRKSGPMCSLTINSLSTLDGDLGVPVVLWASLPLVKCLSRARR